jgi:alcohol dehydrogenase YqhD (iron-dependent ADH family)
MIGPDPEVRNLHLALWVCACIGACILLAVGGCSVWVWEAWNVAR